MGGPVRLRHGSDATQLPIPRNDDSAVQPHQVLGRQLAKASTELPPWDCHELVDHEPACPAQAVAFARLDGEPKERGIGRISREGADRYGSRPVEPVVLEDHRRPRLAGVFRAAGDCPDLAALHGPLHSVRHSQSEIASTNAWSSCA